MRQTITGQQPFQILATNFSISPSSEGYTLQISADGRNFSDLFTVPANTTRMVTNVANGSTFRLNGNNSEVIINWERQCSDGSGGGSGSGGTDPAVVQQMIDASLLDYTQDLIDGEPIVGMASQLYSPDGVDSNGTFNYRNTAGNADVNSGVAELKKVGGNSIYPEITYDDSASLERGGEPVADFDYDIEWGNSLEWTETPFDTNIGVSGLTMVKVVNPWKDRTYTFRMVYNTQYTTDFPFKFVSSTGKWSSSSNRITQIDENTFEWHIENPTPTSMAGTAVWNPDTKEFVFTQTNGFSYSYIQQVLWTGGAGQTDELYYGEGENIPNDIPNGISTYEYSAEWIAYVDTAQTSTIKPQAMKVTTAEGDRNRIYVRYVNKNNENKYFGFDYNGNSISPYSNCTQSGQNIVFGSESDGLSGYVTSENNVKTVTITSGNGYIKTFEFDAGAEFSNIEILLSSWSQPLPQALRNMTVGGDAYVPEDGDEITIDRKLVRSGNAVYPAPSKFVSVGLNSFNKDGNTVISQFSEDGGVYTVAILCVAGLANGYTIFDDNEGITGVGISDSATGTVDTTGAELDARLSYATPTEEKPYLIITTTDIDTLCVHPKWSGYRDEDFEDYMEDEIDLSSFNSSCPLYSVGETRNIWDFANEKLIRNIGTIPYSAGAVNDLLDGGKEIGVDFDFDSNLIYLVLDEPIETSAPKEQLYDASDFGVELFEDANGIIPAKAYAETWYMTNLVDKLRRMEGLVHLDSLSGTGSENTIYECDDKLWFWRDNDGIVAEWTDNPSVLGNDNGYGIVFSHIPDGQTILEFKYQYGGEWRYIKMSGDTLVLTDTGGTVISSCAVGSSAKFETQQYGNIYYINVKLEKHWIGLSPKGNVSYQNIWDGSVEGGHWVIVDHTNYPWLNIATSDEGVPKWNSKGQIVRKVRNNSSKGIQFNTNASQYSATGKIEFLTDGTNNGPSRIFVPTQGGTAGQMLISAGDNAEPTWTNWIKSVQITSAEYEALVTKDPNVLYLIVDE